MPLARRVIPGCCQNCCQIGELPAEPFRGLEVSYSESSARTRIRTRDQLIKSQLLYQLSYAGSDKS